jgi:hypothetical protein
MKPCPLCAREIEDIAVVCPHCGRALSDPAAPLPAAAVSAAAPRPSLVPWLVAGIMAMVATGAIIGMLGARPETASPSAYEPLYRAAQAVTAGVSIGVNYDEYRVLVQALATEVFVARDAAAGPREQSVVSAFTGVLEAHKNALVAWRQKVNAPADVNTDQLDQAIQESWKKADAALAEAIKSYSAR